MNTAMAISGGGLSAMVLEKFFNGELSLMVTLNGMYEIGLCELLAPRLDFVKRLAGAVSVCAGADDMEVWAAHVVMLIVGISSRLFHTL